MEEYFLNGSINGRVLFNVSVNGRVLFNVSVNGRVLFNGSVSGRFAFRMSNNEKLLLCVLSSAAGIIAIFAMCLGHSASCNRSAAGKNIVHI